MIVEWIVGGLRPIVIPAGGSPDTGHSQLALARMRQPVGFWQLFKVHDAFGVPGG